MKNSLKNIKISAEVKFPHQAPSIKLDPDAVRNWMNNDLLDQIRSAISTEHMDSVEETEHSIKLELIILNKEQYIKLRKIDKDGE